MPSVPLPNEPSLEQLRNQARDLQRAVRTGDPAAAARVAEHHPDGVPAADDRVRFPLAGAQLSLAREYGFASWPRLVRHLRVVEQFSREPDEVGESADPAAEFMRLACLNYGADGPDRWAAARRVLAGHPDLPTSGIHAAAASADVGQVARFLAADPAAAGRDGGPYRWQPLVYLAYARHNPQVALDAVVATARLMPAPIRTPATCGTACPPRSRS